MNIGILGFMFLILFALKLLGHIDWSWWWVTAPLWGGMVAWFIFFVGAVLVLAAKEMRR